MFVHYNQLNEVVVYPLKEDGWQELTEGLSIRRLRDMLDEHLADYRVARVQRVTKPQPSDPLTVKVIELDPVLTDGVWLQTWGEVPLTGAEANRERIRAEKAAEEELARADAFIQNVLSRTPEETRQLVLNRNQGTNADKVDAIFRTLGELAFVARIQLGKDYK